MFRPKLFSTQNISRPQVIRNLYTLIAILAGFMLNLGMGLVSLSDHLWGGDPYYSLHHDEFTVCVSLFVIILTAFSIHRSIQRLANFDIEQKTDTASI